MEKTVIELQTFCLEDNRSTPSTTAAPIERRKDRCIDLQIDSSPLRTPTHPSPSHGTHSRFPPPPQPPRLSPRLPRTAADRENRCIGKKTRNQKEPRRDVRCLCRCVREETGGRSLQTHRAQHDGSAPL
ncbi:unnamed protein product [Pleuronectes platessa]|uniref:Uncharacterized protein n=1 Tax=Pleuronectes platessa TaxID=8262 RepID=A0A9N7VRS7_PLEPL|nr:unnamed protein product [Pleuronectes platessa]